MELNQEQIDACDAIYDFLMSEEKYIKVVGKAGTGKSSIIKHIQNSVYDRYTNTFKILDIEPPITSLKVLGSNNVSVSNLNNMDIACNSVHYDLNLVLEVHRNTEPKILKSDQITNVIWHKEIIIIDDFTAINSDLYNFMLEADKGPNKYIFIGDPNSLLANGETVCPIDSISCKEIELKQVHRTNNKDIDSLVDDIINYDGTKAIKIKTSEHIHQIDMHQLNKVIKNIGSKQTASTRILSWDKASALSHSINSNNMPKVGDVISTTRHMDRNGDIILPEHDYIVRHVNGTVSSIPIPDSKLEIKGRMSTLEPLHNLGTTTTAFLPEDPEGIKDLVYDLQKTDNWGTIFFIINYVGFFRNSCSKTIAKSIGSEYDDVYIDLNSIDKISDKALAKQVLYTAVTRAKNNVFFFGSLSKYNLGEIV